MKYRKHSSRDKAFVQVGGKRTYLPGKFNSPESLAAYHRIAAEHGLEPTEVRTIADLIVAYLDHCKVYYEENPGEYRNIRAVMGKLNRACGDVLVSEFGPKRLQAFAEKVKKESSASYANRSASHIKRMFKWGVSQEKVPPMAHHALLSYKSLRVKKERVMPVRYALVRKVIRNSSPIISTMLKIQWLTGCRSGELCRMHIDDIDRSKDIWVWKPRHHKSKWRGKELTMYLGPLAQKILAPWMETTIEGYIFSPLKVRKGYSLTYSTKTYAASITRVIKRLGIEHWSPHRIRHAKASRIRSMHGVEAAQFALGLSSLNTAQIYAEKRDKQARKIAERF